MTLGFRKSKNRSNALKTPLFQRVGISALFFIILMRFIQCANMQRLTGGPKDSIPPQLLEVTPANLSLNFKETEIVLNI